MNKTKIIINADDLGLNPTVNSAIENGIINGGVTSSTILSNTKYLKELKVLIEKYSHESFRIHLNLTLGESFTKSRIFLKYGIIDDNGFF